MILGIILIINKSKITSCKFKILLNNTSKLFEKGRPKDYLPDEDMQKVAHIYLEWEEEEELNKILFVEGIVRYDYNLNPSRYISQNGNG